MSFTNDNCTKTSHIPLDRIRVIVAGLGALGAEVVKNLGLLGCGSVFLVDPDLVENINIGRSALLRYSAYLGQAKVEAMLDAARAMFPGTEWGGLVAEIADLEEEDFKGTDLLFGCVDSDLARTECALLSARFAIPVCDGGLGGTNLRMGRVSWLPGGESACFSCLLSGQRRASLLSYWESAVHACWADAALPQQTQHRWTSTPSMASIVGGMQVEIGFGALREQEDAESPARGSYSLSSYVFSSYASSSYSLSMDFSSLEPVRRLTHARSTACPFHGEVSGDLLSFPVCTLALCETCGSEFKANHRIAWLRRRGICPACGSKDLTVVASQRNRAASERNPMVNERNLADPVVVR
ncbi:MAG TPA: ThiF family adenylyltransferase [Candidatus Angelobacter sp.]|nr:ThiF family adenylyltransferase [Candidatus Angelobacter sp.]